MIKHDFKASLLKVGKEILTLEQRTNKAIKESIKDFNCLVGELGYMKAKDIMLKETVLVPVRAYIEDYKK